MDNTCPLESAVNVKGSHLGKAPIPSLLAAKASLVRAGQIRFCLSGHRLAEGQDTNVPAVIQRKLSLFSVHLKAAAVNDRCLIQ